MNHVETPSQVLDVDLNTRVGDSEHELGTIPGGNRQSSHCTSNRNLGSCSTELYFVHALPFGKKKLFRCRRWRGLFGCCSVCRIRGRFVSDSGQALAFFAATTCTPEPSRDGNPKQRQMLVSIRNCFCPFCLVPRTSASSLHFIPASRSAAALASSDSISLSRLPHYSNSMTRSSISHTPRMCLTFASSEYLSTCPQLLRQLRTSALSSAASRPNNLTWYWQCSAAWCCLLCKLNSCTSTRCQTCFVRLRPSPFRASIFGLCCDRMSLEVSASASSKSLRETRASSQTTTWHSSQSRITSHKPQSRFAAHLWPPHGLSHVS